MQYYAKVNTASPATGFISIGEVLTEKQAAALGEEKLNELVRNNVLGVCADENKPAPASEPDGTDEDQSTESEADSEDADDAGSEETDEDEELPELEMTPDMVNDKAEEAPAPKNGGRRKAK